MTLQEFFSIHFPAFLFTMSLIVLAVLFHYEVLVVLSAWLDRIPGLRRMRMVLVVLGAMAAHLTEIWLFAMGYIGLSALEGRELLRGDLKLGMLDVVYFSGVTFTTVGYGDVAPVGPARFLAAMEALTGLVLITWSASFTYFEMGRFWRKSH